MTRDELYDHFPFLRECEEYNTKKLSDFDNSKNLVKPLFTMPDWLKEFDWLPEYKRQISETEIAYVLHTEKEAKFYWFDGYDIIIVYYNEEKDLWYEVLYHKQPKRELTLQAILVLEDEDWGGASA